MIKITKPSELDQIQQTTQHSKSQVILLETPNGLKFVNPLTKETRLISFSQELIIFDWSNFIEMLNNEESQRSITIFMDEGQKLRFFGDKKLLQTMYDYTVGKYVFQRGTLFIELQNIMTDDNCQIRIVMNKYNRLKYYEKVILSNNNSISQLSMSNITMENESFLPEEIQIILDLHRTSTPYLLKVDSIFYDGVHYSYIYRVGCKKLQRLVEYYNKKKDQQYFLIQITKQLLHLALILEEKQIVMPNINHKSLFINSENNEIILMNYNSVFYCNKICHMRKSATLGYAPPEYFQEQTQVSSKANIFQVGVLLYYLLFGHSPYGKDSQEILQNTLNCRLNLAPLKQGKKLIFDFIESLLEKSQQKRPTALEAQKHQIFTPVYLQSLSLKQINSQYSNHIQLTSTDEFENFNQISNIQKVKINLNSFRRE